MRTGKLATETQDSQLQGAMTQVDALASSDNMNDLQCHSRVLIQTTRKQPTPSCCSLSDEEMTRREEAVLGCRSRRPFCESLCPARFIKRHIHYSCVNHQAATAGTRMRAHCIRQCVSLSVKVDRVHILMADMAEGPHPESTDHACARCGRRATVEEGQMSKSIKGCNSKPRDCNSH